MKSREHFLGVSTQKLLSSCLHLKLPPSLAMCDFRAVLAFGGMRTAGLKGSRAAEAWYRVTQRNQGCCWQRRSLSCSGDFRVLEMPGLVKPPRTEAAVGWSWPDPMCVLWMVEPERQSYSNPLEPEEWVLDAGLWATGVDWVLNTGP